MLIGQRWIICILGFYACGLVYLQRANMSVAIVAMTRPKSQQNSLAADVGDDGRFGEHNMSRSTEAQKGEFDWSETLQGVVLGSSYYLYIFVPTLAGRITDSVGAKWIAFSGTLGPCVLSALTPWAVRTLGVGALIAIRILMGGFHGFIYASLFSLYVRWFPPKERATASAALVFGGAMGSTVMNLLAGVLAETSFGWPLVFYVSAAFHVPWLLAWLYFASNTPAEHRLISNQELTFITENIPPISKRKLTSTPWLRIILSTAVLCSLLTKMCAGFGYFLLLTKMPTYLATVFNMSLVKNGGFNAVTTMANALTSLFAAPLATFIIRKTGVPSIWVRKLFQGLAMFGPALCIGLIPLLGSNADQTTAVCLLIGSQMMYGFFTGGEWSTISDYAPNFSGTIFGYVNILAIMMAVVAPYLVGVLLDADQLEETDVHRQWDTVWIITSCTYLLGGIVYILFATDQQQPWDKAYNVDEDVDNVNGKKEEEQQTEIEKAQDKEP